MSHEKPIWAGKKCADCADHDDCWILKTPPINEYPNESACGSYREKDPQENT